MPKASDSGWRNALGTLTNVDKFIAQISPNQTSLAFFNELLRLLIFEGKPTLLSFLNSLEKSDLLGIESQNRLSILIKKIEDLTNEEWEREFYESADNNGLPCVPFVVPQLDISTFTGRKDELKQLEEVLLSQSGEKVCSIVGLTGGGGIGKSALACHFATIHRDKFPDGVIGLRVDKKDVNTIVLELARQIGKPVDLDDYIEPGAIMQELFASRRMLLIFDNAENADDIKVLRPGGNLCAVIVTTRNQQLPFSLDVAEAATIRLQSLPAKDALELLRKILGESRINTALAAAQRITNIVGRLPLALQVVGAALRGKPRSLETFAESLQTQKDQLKLLPRLRVRGDKELNVEASLNLSLELLEEEEIDFFACLSVCAEEGFALKTAMAAADCEDEWEAEEFLNTLYGLSLLNYAETEQNRFVLHPLVREYAKSLAQERNLLTIAQERHAQFFVDWLQSDNVEDITVVAEVAANLDDVILAAELLQHQKVDTPQRKMKTYQFILQLQPLLEKYGYWQKAITLVARFQSWAEQFEDWNAVVKYKMHEARYWSFAGEFERAEEILHSAQANLLKIEDLDTQKRREAKVLTVLGGVLQKQDKFKDARQVFEQAIEIAETLNDQSSLAIGLNCLGGLLQKQGKLEEAQQTFERGIKIAETLNDQSSLAIGLNCLGGLLQKQGKLEEAQQTFERQIEIAETLNDQFSLAIGLNRLGGLLQKQGKLEEAQQTFERQIEIAETLNNQSQLAIGLNCLGVLLQQQNKLEEAQQAFERSIKIDEALNDQSSLAIGLNCLGGLLQKQGKLEEAQQTFERQIEIAETLNNQSQLAIGLIYLRELLNKQGKLEEAQVAFERSIEVNEALNNQSQLATDLKRLGRLLHKQGKFEEAQQACERYIEVAQALNNQSQLATGLKQLGRLLQQQGKIEEAQQAFERCIEIAENLNDPERISWLLNNLGGIALQQNKFELPIEYYVRAVQILREHGNEQFTASSLNSLGIAFHQYGSSLLGQHKLLDKALEVLEKSQEIFTHLNATTQVALVLHSLGRAWKLKREFEKAEILLKQSQEIFEDEKDFSSLAKVMNTLGGVLEGQQKWDEAEKILRQSYDLAVKLEDKRGQAIITNSLAQVIAHQEGEDKFELSQMYFRHSIKLGEELNDRQHLAKVHTAMGKIFLAREDFEKAVSELAKGFEIDESFSNIRGLKIIIRNLTYTLSRLGKREEALAYCERAIKIAPNHLDFLQLRDKIQRILSRDIQHTSLKVGLVLYIQYDHKNKLRWGKIAPDDWSSNITFNEKFIGSDSVSKLSRGALVEVEVKEIHGKLYAKQIKVIEEEDEEFC
jgi:tetratricopeptide (TPR) repeat protein